MRPLGKNKILVIFVLTLLFLNSWSVFAYVSGSDNYRIQTDSFNTSAKDLSSGSYRMRDTTGEISSGDISSTGFKLRAGFQYMQETYLALVAPANITMSNIDLTQDSAIGTGDAWNVKTDNPAGYILSLNTDKTNTLSSPNDAFTDFSGTPQTWSVSNTYEFGFSVYGADVSTATWGTDSSCGNSGVPSGTLKWRGFNSSTAISVASVNSRTSTPGTDTVLCVAAEQNNVYASSGFYVSNITGTALTQ